MLPIMQKLRRTLTANQKSRLLEQLHPRISRTLASLAPKESADDATELTKQESSSSTSSSSSSVQRNVKNPVEMKNPDQSVVPEDVNTLEGFRRVFAVLGVPTKIGQQFKPDPFLREQINVKNQQEILRVTMTPFSVVPYVDQLRFKHLRNKSLVRNLSKTLSRKIPNIFLDDDGLMCPVDRVVPSPVLTRFRNKDEFCVGQGVDGYPKRVGFFVGRNREDNVVTVFPENFINMRPSHRLLAKKFEEYIMDSDLDAFKILPNGNQGHYKAITARSTSAGELMGIIIIHPQDLTRGDLENEKARIKEFFLDGPGKVCKLNSLYFQACQHHRCTPLQARFELIFGKEYLIEKCGKMQFRISPSAFFQLNVEAAAKLYDTIGQLIQPDSNSILLDICCGTGTIGIYLASKFDKVIGIERDLLAVGDANFNADLNQVSNATYYCGDVQKILPRLLYDKNLTYSSISAVINPGRNGVASNVINALRKTQEVDRVIYVSCKPIGTAMSNLTDLAVPNSDSHPGEPFFPVRAVPVDMFPHTDHCELVILYERNRLFFL